jgi:hypothetical protein
MKETAIELSKELRDPEGEHRVEVVIALTHCRVPNVSPWLWEGGRQRLEDFGAGVGLMGG